MSLESHKKDILNRLQEAGAKGLSKTGLSKVEYRPGSVSEGF